MYQMLIVEDRYELRQSLCHYIPWETIGFTVSADFGEADKALAYLMSNPSVDVVLCDILMPVMSGMDLAREIHERKIPCKIVFLSAYKDFEYAKQAMRYGVYDYLIKPATYSDLEMVFGRIREELDAKGCTDVQIADRLDPSTAQSHYERIVCEAQRYVIEHYASATLESVAAYLHISPQFFSRLYKKVTGRNFSDLLNEVRMKNAERLLRDVHIKTGQVGEMVGYSNANNFARAFRNHFRMSPSEYRACHHIEDNDR